MLSTVETRVVKFPLLSLIPVVVDLPTSNSFESTVSVGPQQLTNFKPSLDKKNISLL